MASGDLNQEKVLSQLDKGLFLSNIHYLNWSDNPGGRITGLTRYACFWVDGGEILAPIETIFLLTSAKTSYISSSIVREVIRNNGDYTLLVPESVRVG